MKRHPLQLSVKFSVRCLLAACLVLLCGCSSIKVVETWNSPRPSGHRYQKIMIVGIGRDENARALIEDILAAELERGGVRAVASHTLVKNIDNARRDDVVAAVRSTGADAVLSLKVIGKGDTSVSQGGQSGGIYGTAGNIGGTLLPGARDYSLATVQTNLYDSATAELVWSATVKTYDAERPARVSRDLAGFFLEKLRKDGLL
jgi:hypothetical protein